MWFISKMNQFFIFLMLPFILAPTSREVRSGIGGVALNLMDPVSIFSGFISTACLLLGGAFIFAGIIKYIEHRRSPLMVPISTVVFLLIAGIALVLLPLIYNWTEHGVPFWMAEV